MAFLISVDEPAGQKVELKRANGFCIVGCPAVHLKGLRGSKLKILLMLDRNLFVLFVAAALILAATPGPGIFYVLGRALSGGRREGILSSLGTLVGGLVHVVAAALGLSAVLAASALAFSVVKYAGALYLVWIGITMIRTRNQHFDSAASPIHGAHVFRQGILTEVLNPKTALFFLSFLPQFVSPHLGHVVEQFLVLGCVSVSLNTLADFIVVMCASPLGTLLRSNPRFRRRQRVASGIGMIGLGAFVAFGERN
jgi:threonine/homoserine/homoserine lactone efflux protein